MCRELADDTIQSMESEFVAKERWFMTISKRHFQLPSLHDVKEMLECRDVYTCAHVIPACRPYGISQKDSALRKATQSRNKLRNTAKDESACRYSLSENETVWRMGA
jgi:hypothetical protein